MPEFLADGQPIATQNTYLPQLTLGPAPGVKRINLSVLGANGAIIQCWRYNSAARDKFALEQIQRVIAGQSIGVVIRGAAGVQIASAVANQSTNVVGELVYGHLDWDGGDIEIDGGAITSAIINSGGGVNPPPPTGMNVQHNGLLVGTEPTLDLLDGSGVSWTVVDDSGNTRIQVTGATPGSQLDYAQITANPPAVTATTEGTAVVQIAGNSVTYDGSRVKVEFFVPLLTGTAGYAFLVFLRDSTVIGHAQVSGGAGTNPTAAKIEAFDTPPAGPHTYKIAMYVNATSSTINAGPGGSGNLLPAFLRVTKA